MRGIASRYVKILTPIMLAAALILISGIFWYDWQNQLLINAETSKKNVETANNSLQTWLGDQISIVRTLSEDPRLAAACANPSDPTAVEAARTFLKSVHGKYPYYENIPLVAKLPANASINVMAEGKMVAVKSGQFFIDTVDNKTIGKGGESARFIKEVLDGKPYFISHVYPSFLRGNPLFVISAPVKRDGVVIGAVLVAPQMNYFTDRFVNSVRMGETGYVFMMDDRGMIIAHPAKENILNEKMVERFKPLLDKVKTAKERVMLSFQGSDKSFYGGRLDSDPERTTNQWYLIATQERSEIMAPSIRIAWMIGAFILVTFGALYMIVFWVTRRLILAPLGETTVYLERAGKGDFSIRFKEELLARNDEFGNWARSMQTMISNIKDMIGKVAKTTEQVAAASQEMTASAQQTSETSLQVAEAVARVARGAEEGSEAKEESGRTVQELVGRMENVQHNVNDMAEFTRNAQAKTSEGAKTAEVTIEQIAAVSRSAERVGTALRKLSDSSARIGDIVQLISGIAAQTNLLALNAAIEAARAGEQGRGFAVVAEEVRKLAEQSQDAAKQIIDLIQVNSVDLGQANEAMQTAQTEVGRGVETVNETGRQFEFISGLVADIVSRMQEISNTVSQVEGNIESIRVSSGKVGRIIGETAVEAETVSAATQEQSAALQEMAASSRGLATMAQELAEAVQVFRV